MIYFLILISTVVLTGSLPAEESLVVEKPIVIVMGTRPEAIKLLPVYSALRKEQIPTLLCMTGQHRELAQDVLKVFKVDPDADLDIMKPGQDLFYITETVLNKLKGYFQEVSPSLVIVQGDTTSALAASLAAFYLKIPVAHVEAGLRSGNMQAPFPEEMNRRCISVLASLNFAPTQVSFQNLIHEGIDPTGIFVTGNTVVDALLFIQQQIANKELLPSPQLQELVEKVKGQNKKLILLTAHRRESFEGGLHHIFNAFKRVLKEEKDLFVVFPAHPNPAVGRAYHETGLDLIENIYVTKPVPYFDLVYLLSEVDGVATDSGGIQEESVSLQKPTLILRNETDRPEGIDAKIAELVGTDEDTIYNALIKIIRSSKSSTRESFVSPYGDGRAAEKIASIIKSRVNTLHTPKKGSTP